MEQTLEVVVVAPHATDKHFTCTVTWNGQLDNRPPCLRATTTQFLRRYRDFDTLRKTLVRVFPELCVPPLPGKKGILALDSLKDESKTHVKQQYRKYGIRLFFQDVLKHQTFSSVPILQKFCDANVEDLSKKPSYFHKIKMTLLRIPSDIVPPVQKAWKSLHGGSAEAESDESSLARYYEICMNKTKCPTQFICADVEDDGEERNLLLESKAMFSQLELWIKSMTQMKTDMWAYCELQWMKSIAARAISDHAEECCDSEVGFCANTLSRLHGSQCDGLITNLLGPIGYACGKLKSLQETMWNLQRHDAVLQRCKAQSTGSSENCSVMSDSVIFSPDFPELSWSDIIKRFRQDYIVVANDVMEVVGDIRQYMSNETDSGGLPNGKLFF